MKSHRPIRIGIAGWNIPKQHADEFAKSGSHLERYAARFSAVEINSSFYRPHRPGTYERWAAGVPSHFKFSAKLPRAITHHRKLIGIDDALREFLEQVMHLGKKLGPLLVQLPPSLRYDEKIAAAFFKKFREMFIGEIACEPRHTTWFTGAVDDLLLNFAVARVAADPAVVSRASEPSGTPGFIYRRLHGSPKMYYSSYGANFMEELAQKITRQNPSIDQWCIFDNTALGEATKNAFELMSLLESGSRPQARAFSGEGKTGSGG